MCVRLCDHVIKRVDLVFPTIVLLWESETLVKLQMDPKLNLQKAVN